MAAVISRALADIAGDLGGFGASDHVRDEAMAWINGPECEAFCLALDMDYTAVRKKAAALYRRFLEKAEEPRESPGKPRKRPGHSEGTFFIRKPRSGTAKYVYGHFGEGHGPR
jgi:hypothetical protein